MLHLQVDCEKNENKQKSGRDWPILRNSKTYATVSNGRWGAMGGGLWKDWPFEDVVVVMLADLEVDGDRDEDVCEDVESLPELANLQQRVDGHRVAVAQEAANKMHS